jgi:lipoprotein signal peptidase
MAFLRRSWWAVGGFIFPVGVDQWGKYVSRLVWPESALCNDAGPWGVSVSPMVIAVAGLGALLVVSVLYRKRFFPALPFVLLAAGGVGNLVDRFRYGCVRDQLWISWFPAFNGADVFLTAAVCIVLWQQVSCWKRPSTVAQ